MYFLDHQDLVRQIDIFENSVDVTSHSDRAKNKSLGSGLISQPFYFGGFLSLPTANAAMEGELTIQ